MLTPAPRTRDGRSAVVPLVIGVTSHRNISATELAGIRQHVAALFGRLQAEFPGLPLTVLSALAEGGDQLVAEEALAAGARLIAPLPMARAQYAADFPDTPARARFDALCDAAEIIELPLAEGRARTARFDAPSGHERNLRYAQAGVFISQHCHLLLAIWDGKTSDRLGGTAQVVNFHLTGVRLAPEERRRGLSHATLLGVDSERLVYHIVSSRVQDDGAPQPPLRPLQTYWRSGEEVRAGEQPMPAQFHEMFEHAADFAADCVNYAKPIEACVAKNAPAADVLGRLFHIADWLAIHFQKRVLLAMRTLYTVAALMGIAFTVYDNLPAHDYMIFVFLLLFVVAGVVVVTAKRRGWHRKYLDYRALAEGLRVQSFWRRAGLSITGDAEFARDNFMQKQDVELGWIRNLMRSAALESSLAGTPVVADDLSNVVREWVGDAGQGGQLDYYRRKGMLRASTHRRTEAIGAAALCVGIGISVVLALMATRLSTDVKNWLVVIMAAFSIVAAVREAYAYRKADKELIKQYRFMQKLFGDARAALDRAADADERRDILRLLGEAALAEHVEWALMHRARPLEHARP
ncbi:MAG: hypothetical protein ABI843_15145 [Dokdonella sp.]